MNVLGLSCGFATERDELGDNWPIELSHDSASALVSDGAVVAAVEEERLNRVKHTNKFPEYGIRACLEQAGINPTELDGIAFYWTEAELDKDLDLVYAERPRQPRRYTRELLTERLSETLGHDIDPALLHFVRHHTSHASGTYYHSGFSDALVVVMDGRGEKESISVMSGSGGDLAAEPVRTYGIRESLGFFYRTAIEMLGYGLFDEYKVMGLAPYGNPERFRKHFQRLYDLTPDGGYELDVDDVLPYFVDQGFHPRAKGAPFTQEHKDFAAAVQEALETIALHVVTAAQKQTGHTRLCLSGGVALNCTMSGRILQSGLFDEMFVDPASHDAGASAGAAHYVAAARAPRRYHAVPLSHAYLGPSIGGDREVERTLSRWSSLVEVRHTSDPAAEAADLLAEDKVIGWVQGRSEFGPRALGNRSILGDPRSAGNRDRINAIVKRRESYRPFAPATVAEEAARFFDFKDGMPLRYMVASVAVRPEARDLLGAVTHVDGSARLQVIERDHNPGYWEVITEFGKRTGVPVVLNTSFNNDVEPVVQSVEDALVCFLTTRLDALFVGPYAVTKRAVAPSVYRSLSLRLPPQVSLEWTREADDGAAAGTGQYALRFRLTGGRSEPLSHRLGELLRTTAFPVTVADLLDREQESATEESLAAEIVELWSRRMIVLEP
ncbi:carbamoyltransferase family protein [Streptomyces bluensis]|uniref:carbamoyltransferase family protein n=1 Tax=Streptomyces bluensis TaxID=33897 RepID=UPI0016743833|nr:carbamoyltransferase C-terminal domain-containing protein [Streptomyces bluensis]GGZ97234.1 nodulation protein NolNO [Streptomyces bluensis]